MRSRYSVKDYDYCELKPGDRAGRDTWKEVVDKDFSGVAGLLQTGGVKWSG